MDDSTEKEIPVKEDTDEEIEEDVCELCGGLGLVYHDEDDGEGHMMRGVGAKRCICKIGLDYDD